MIIMSHNEEVQVAKRLVPMLPFNIKNYRRSRVHVERFLERAYPEIDKTHLEGIINKAIILGRDGLERYRTIPTPKITKTLAADWD